MRLLDELAVGLRASVCFSAESNTDDGGADIDADQPEALGPFVSAVLDGVDPRDHETGAMIQ